MTSSFRETATLLPCIHSPEDIKQLSYTQLNELAKEIRACIVEVVKKNGGHLASNLGAVELTIALHRVFNSPEDALVWDVSHQSYTHKLLTGRYEQFSTLRKHGGLAGFTKRSESPHDFFDAGHASTSISSALGLLLGRSVLHTSGKVVAIIGDGALSGGMAFEALSHSGQIAKNLIVVINDNQMSISPNTGSLSRHLSNLTMTSHYQSFRNTVDHWVTRIPVFHRQLEKFIFYFKRGLKGLLLTNNFFADLGFEYVGVLRGHNIKKLEDVFRRVQNLTRPVIVHVVTKKGKGYLPAEKDPEKFHGFPPPPALSDSSTAATESPPTFTAVFAREMVRLASENERIAAITASMVKGTGLAAFAQQFPERFFDVGIAEEHAITFAAGLAASGMIPVAAVYSTFMQRSIDQLIHDVAIPAFPVVIAMDRAGAVPDDGETHQGIFDIALMRPIPNIVLASPASAQELTLFLEWALQKNSRTEHSALPVAIRYPKNYCPKEIPEFSLPLELGRGVLIRQGVASGNSGRILFVCTGGIFPEVRTAAEMLTTDGVDIYNLRFLKPIDEDYFLSIAAQYDAVIFVEDGVKIGGIGEYLERLVQAHTSADKMPTRVCSLGFPDRFLAQGTRAEILADAGLSPECIVQAAKEHSWR